MVKEGNQTFCFRILDIDVCIVHIDRKNYGVQLEVYTVAESEHDGFQKNWVPIILLKKEQHIFWVIQKTRSTTVRALSKPLFCKDWFL